jgi:hypothetical protein
VELVGSVFKGGGRPGDFNWMIRQQQYDDALFIFNDNEQEFRAHQGHAPGSQRCQRGGGNAVIRPYQCQQLQRAAGIPTGSSGVGYQGLNDHVRQVIDEAVQVAADLLAGGRFEQVIYSAANETGDLGTGIFEVGPDVRAYIVDGLRRVVQQAR